MDPTALVFLKMLLEMKLDINCYCCNITKELNNTCTICDKLINCVCKCNIVNSESPIFICGECVKANYVCRCKTPTVASISMSTNPQKTRKKGKK